MPHNNFQNILAFDFGASSGRAILGRYDGERLTVETVHQFPNGPIHCAGRMYWDVLRFVSEIQEGIRKAIKVAGGPIASMGIDTWGVDFGLLDKRGELIGNPYHYRDPRTDGMFEEAFRRMPRERIFALTGVAFQPFNTLYQLLATRLGAPAILDSASSLLMMPDLLAYLLTGEKGTEYTDASTTQMLDASARTWSVQLLKAMDLPEHLFGVPSAPGALRGMLLSSLAADLGIAPFPVIAVAGHDTASAVVATPLLGSGSAYLSSGTWSLLGAEIDSPRLGPEVMAWNFTNEGGVGGTYRLLQNVMGLWILQECQRHWTAAGSTRSFADLVVLAEASESSCALIDPDHPMFYAPGNMEERVRSFCVRTGQKPPEAEGAIVRCILTSLAFKYRFVIERLDHLVGARVSSLCIVGGGTRNHLLNRLTATAIGRPVFAGPSEATAIGNILMQLHACGELRNVGEMRSLVRNSFPVQSYPAPDTVELDDAYMRFVQVVQSGRSTS
jgi:rhamnulokinase